MQTVVRKEVKQNTLSRVTVFFLSSFPESRQTVSEMSRRPRRFDKLVRKETYRICRGIIIFVALVTGFETLSVKCIPVEPGGFIRISINLTGVRVIFFFLQCEYCQRKGQVKNCRCPETEFNLHFSSVKLHCSAKKAVRLYWLMKLPMQGFSLYLSSGMDLPERNEATFSLKFPFTLAKRLYAIAGA